jgi:glycosyltransferase involved in cell wall biosynthesis
LDDRDKVLVNVGRQEYQKGQRFLLEATAQLVPKHPRLKLVIAGRPGNASTELHRALDQLGIEERVKFLGHREDVPEILAAGDVFVFPSLYEGLGGSLIEAMALGLPIVASDIPAVRDVLEENRNALLVSPASPEELAFSITRVLEDHELARRFRQRSVEIFHERFTLDKSAARMIQLYSWMVTGTEVPYPDVQ